MKKGRGFTRRVFAGIVALVLAGAVATALAKGEDQSGEQAEPETELINLFKHDYEITSPDFGVWNEYKYVSENGGIEKWYSSYMPVIDGLTRTSERRKRKYIDYLEGESCDIQEEHAHLYTSQDERGLLPFYNEDQYVTLNGIEYLKTVAITQADKEGLEILYEYGLFRLCDNLDVMQIDIDYIHMFSYYGYVCYNPKSITKKEMIVEPIVIVDKEAYYNETMNGYLIGEVGDIIAINQEQYPNGKTLTLKKQ